MPAARRAGFALTGADQEAGDRLDGPLGGREPDALRPVLGESVEPLQREGKVRPRLSRATAWISSTITVRTVRGASASGRR